MGVPAVLQEFFGRDGFAAVEREVTEHRELPADQTQIAIDPKGSTVDGEVLLAEADNDDLGEFVVVLDQ